MSKIIKSTDGVFYRVEPEQEVSAEEVQSALDRCQAEADALRALVAPVEQPANGDQGNDGQPTANDQGAPADGSQAATDNQPAPSADGSAPVAPAADPAAAPVPPADGATPAEPAADQGQVADQGAAPAEPVVLQ